GGVACRTGRIAAADVDGDAGLGGESRQEGGGERRHCPRELRELSTWGGQHRHGDPRLDGREDAAADAPQRLAGGAKPNLSPGPDAVPVDVQPAGEEAREREEVNRGLPEVVTEGVEIVEVEEVEEVAARAVLGRRDSDQRESRGREVGGELRH